MIKNVVKELNIPITALIAMKKDFSKPNPHFFLQNFKDEYDKKQSFYVGDAAGRDGDWSEKDKLFATNIGVNFYTPEEIFPLDKTKPKTITPQKHKEIIIMVGYPGSGKTTIAKSMTGYIRIDGDALKTPAKMIKEAEKYIDNHSVIFDATNPTKERRALFIDFAKKNNVPVRCIRMSASIDTAMEQNREREVRVPDVVFYVFRKKFEEPTNEECEIVRI
jgi:bifunctional polynucleotide phosphatase/kinase